MYCKQNKVEEKNNSVMRTAGLCQTVECAIFNFHAYCAVYENPVAYAPFPF